MRNHGKTTICGYIIPIIFCTTAFASTAHGDYIDVCLDPGHGGCSGINPCGAITHIGNYDTCSICNYYYSEKHVNLQVALELEILLETGIVPPYTPYMWSYGMTRQSDSAVSPSQRAYMANALH